MTDNITIRQQHRERLRMHDGGTKGGVRDWEMTLFCVEESLEKISRDPKLYPAIHKKIRRAMIRRFPYGILCFLEKDEIVVVGVFHSSRNPKRWKNRA